MKKKPTKNPDELAKTYNELLKEHCRLTAQHLELVNMQTLLIQALIKQNRKVVEPEMKKELSLFLLNNRN